MKKTIRRRKNSLACRTFENLCADDLKIIDKRYVIG